MKPKGHKRGCRCVACSPRARAKGRKALLALRRSMRHVVKARRKPVRSVAVKRSRKENPLQIRPKVYRGKPGFVLSGHITRGEGGWPTNIFVRHRATAQAIRRALKAGDRELVRQLVLRESELLENPRRYCSDAYPPHDPGGCPDCATQQGGARHPGDFDQGPLGDRGAWILARAKARDRRDWKTLPPDFESDAAQAAVDDIRPHLASSEFLRVRKAKTFKRLYQILDSILGLPRSNPTWRKGPPSPHREPKTYDITPRQKRTPLDAFTLKHLNAWVLEHVHRDEMVTTRARMRRFVEEHPELLEAGWTWTQVRDHVMRQENPAQGVTHYRYRGLPGGRVQRLGFDRDERVLEATPAHKRRRPRGRL